MATHHKGECYVARPEVWTSLRFEYPVFHFSWFILLTVFSSSVNSYHYSAQSLLLTLIDISICLSYHMMCLTLYFFLLQ
jgi:hypothetical protein